MLIGETYLPNIAELAKQYGPPDKPEFHLPMDTQVGFINKLDVATFRARLNDVETQIGGNVPLLLFDNHDNPRIEARYGDGVHDTDIQRVLSSILFASRGSALFYYGDEIGMKTTPPTRKKDVKDPVGVTGWPEEKGRDGERTPMQWDASVNAGFTKTGATPWLPVPPSAATINVAAEKGDPNSLLAWYQGLIRLKKTNLAFAQRREHDAGHRQHQGAELDCGRRRGAGGGGECELHRRAADGEPGYWRRGLGRQGEDAAEDARGGRSSIAGSHQTGTVWGLHWRSTVRAPIRAEPE